MSLAEAAAEFLSHRRIAVVGLSRSQPNAGNIIYKRLRAEGYMVYACNPATDMVEGDRCYRSLAAIDVRLDGVVVATHPDVALSVVKQCMLAGVERVWLHRAIGRGSLSHEAVEFCEANGIAVIDGACPMMFIEPVDTAHRCFRWFLGATGKLPSGARYQADPLLV